MALSRALNYGKTHSCVQLGGNSHIHQMPSLERQLRRLRTTLDTYSSEFIGYHLNPSWRVHLLVKLDAH